MTTIGVTLAIDLGSCMGWAIFHGKRRYASGVVKFKQRTRKKIKEPRGVKYIQFLDALRESVEGDGPIPLLRAPDIIVFEQVRGNWLNASSREVYGGMLAQLEIFSINTGIPLVGVGVSTIKKFATGRGNARKDEMMKAARRIWRGIKLATDDEADALHIGRVHLEGGVP